VSSEPGPSTFTINGASRSDQLRHLRLRRSLQSGSRTRLHRRGRQPTAISSSTSSVSTVTLLSQGSKFSTKKRGDDMPSTTAQKGESAVGALSSLVVPPSNVPWYNEYGTRFLAERLLQALWLRLDVPLVPCIRDSSFSQTMFSRVILFLTPLSEHASGSICLQVRLKRSHFCFPLRPSPSPSTPL